MPESGGVTFMLAFMNIMVAFYKYLVTLMWIYLLKSLQTKEVEIKSQDVIFQDNGVNFQTANSRSHEPFRRLQSLTGTCTRSFRPGISVRSLCLAPPCLCWCSSQLPITIDDLTTTTVEMFLRSTLCPLILDNLVKQASTLQQLAPGLYYVNAVIIDHFLNVMNDL